jgi:murein DD-endopeptidase MepM/ murein hydrolase activator NlpD
MIGLALSMGASSLLLPHQEDAAAAAEPMTAESVTAAPLAAKSASRVPVSKVGPSSIESSSSFIEHVVRPGETLWQISRQYRVPVRAIAAVNGGELNTLIKVGQVVRVPASRRDVQRNVAASASQASLLSARAEAAKAERDESRAQLQQQRERLKRVLSTLPSRSSDVSAFPQVPTPPVQAVEKSSVSQAAQSTDKESTDKAAVTIVHQIKPGETLGQIATQYGTSQGELVTLNRLSDPDEIRVSASLVVPFGTLPETEQVPVVPTIPPVEGSIAVSQPEILENQTTLAYQVQAGDTISEIARTHGIARSELVAVNRLADPDLITAGQLLKLPDDKELAVSTVIPSVTIASASPEIPVIPTLAEARGSEPATGVTLPSAATEAKSDVPTLPSVLPDSSATITAFSPEFTSTEAAPSVEATPAVSFAPTGENGSVGNAYVQNLLSEVIVMRDRYIAERGTASASSDAPAVVASTSLTSLAPMPAVSDASRINPEFSPERAAAASSSLQSPGFEARQAPDAEPNGTGGTEPQVVAVAPLGSENYAPLLRPIEGQVVSPELPPLPSAEAYLPSSSAAFAGYMWPARGVLTSGYGWRWGRMHRGIDIGAPVGTPVFAAAPGVVQFSGWNSGGYGNMVEIRHPDGSMTRYAHHSRNIVRVGQQISQGDQIAEVGSTGYSTGPHLHFEVHLPSQGTVNPIAYLPSR